MTLFSKYKDIGGVPRKGVHKWRIMGDIAAFDYFGTILLAILTTWFTKVPIEVTTIIWMLISVLSHYLFGVETSTIKWLKKFS